MSVTSVSGALLVVLIALLWLVTHLANHSSADGIVGYGLYFLVVFVLAIADAAVFFTSLLMKIFR